MGKEKLDLLIKNVMIVNGRQGTVEKGCVAVAGGRIAAYDPATEYLVGDEIDGNGYYLSPGWIDSHTHIFTGVTEPGFAADLGLIPMGVTTAIDGGSAGVATWPVFKQKIVDSTYLNVFYSLNVSPAGQITERYPENVDPAHYDVSMLRRIMETDSQHARGLKLRYGAEVVAGIDDDVLGKTLELAEELQCAITIHVTNPPCPMEDILERLRPGDVVCHAYQGKGSTIIDEHGHVKEAAMTARRRGVRFDSADARINHSYRVIKQALAEGFIPDIISTDMTKNGIFNNMCWGLPVVLSKWFNLGLSLPEVIAACTCNPAAIHHLPDGIGTLDIGAAANLTVFSVEERPFHLRNRLGEDFTGKQMLIPQVTIINGNVRFKNLYFPF
ncbi:amidohydrolase family protein [Megasphaera vaginalis (ex Bordigoni et al. 2020)]|uniref:amidohydrolase family protein n=1 Tax=Megasphaera vaginalis (ex Bordigoni et al. 2020) TaxID=2045301 RepID=UPI000C796B40|nr:amidohydrolase family protein [Megasphaera vaginalis (ex Bordigoni et al. 2020)]